MKSFDHNLRIRVLSDKANRWAVLALVAIIYYVAARLGLLLAFESTNASPIWPPSGIAFAAVLLLGWRIWPAITLAAFVANFAVFSANHVAASATTAVASLAIAIGNTLEAIVGAYLLRAFIRSGNLFDQPSHVFKFSITVILMCVVSAVIGTQTLMFGELAPAAARATIILNWWLGDVGGALVVMPLLLCWLTPPGQVKPRPMRLEVAASLAGLLVIAALVFSGRFFSLHVERLLLVLCFFCEAWAAYRFGRRGVTLASLLFAMAAVLGTVKGVGPFTAGPLNDSLILLVGFIALSSVSGLVLAADLAERDGLQENSQTGWRELTSSWLALLGALSLTVLAWHLMSSDTERRAADQFHQSAAETQLLITKRLIDVESILRGAQGLFAASDSVNRDEWSAYIARLKIGERFPGILGVGYAPVIGGDVTDAFVAEMNATGFKSFKVWPQPEQKVSTPILYIEPANEYNLRAVGFNMFSESSRRAAMSLARDSGNPVVSGNVILVQDTDTNVTNVHKGVLMYLPVYRNGMSHTTLAERRAALAGYVLSAFRVGELVEGAVGHSAATLRLDVFDGIDDTAPLMYSSRASFVAAKHRDRALLTETLPAEVGQRMWTLRFTALPEFERIVDRQKAQLVLIAGSVISLLLFTLMRSLALTTERALRMADEMNAALRNSEQKLRLLIDGATDYAIFMLDPHGLVMSWNSGAEHIKGYREEEIVGEHFSRFYSPDDIARDHPNTVLKTASTAGNFHEEGWRVRKDGSLFWADVSITALHDRDGKLSGFSKVTRDLSARKTAEEALSAMSQRLGLATQAAGIGIWDWDLPTDVLTWDDQLYAMYQTSRDSGAITYESWGKLVIPEDLTRIEKELEAALKDSTRYESEFRVVLPDGEIHTISAIIVIIRNEKGEPQNIVGVNWDITDMRRTQNALRASEERFRSALEYAPIGMAVVSLEGAWLEVNRAICDMLGYEKQKLMEMTFQDVTHPDDLEVDLSKLRDLVDGRIHSYQIEKRYISKSGNTVWVMLTVSLVKDRAQQPLYFISQIEDISDRKQKDLQIRVALAEKEMLLKEVYHRVKNNLQVVISLFNLQINSLSDEVARTALRESADRVRAMALVHEKLYASSNLASLPIAEYVTGLCRQIEASNAMGQRSISIRCDIDPIELGMDMAIPLGLLLNELISNCMKHAFRADQSGQIGVSVKRLDEFSAELSVMDDGVGLPPNFDPERIQSLGIKLSFALSRQLGGIIRFEKIARGTRVLVAFRLPAAKTSESHLAT